MAQCKQKREAEIKNTEMAAGKTQPAIASCENGREPQRQRGWGPRAGRGQPENTHVYTYAQLKDTRQRGDEGEGREDWEEGGKQGPL